MSSLPIFQILEEANSKKRKKDRIAVLHKHSSKQLKAILDYTFNPKIKWLLPEGTPPYKPSEDADNVLFSRLYQEIKRLPIFLNIGSYSNLNKSRREMLFINLLESVHPKDAELLCSIKEKVMPYRNVSEEVVREAFPILTKNWE